MVEVITARQLAILKLVSKNPGIRRDHLLALKEVTPADLAYMEQHDMIWEREIGCFRISYFGELVLKRGV